MCIFFKISFELGTTVIGRKMVEEIIIFKLFMRGFLLNLRGNE